MKIRFTIFFICITFFTKLSAQSLAVNTTGATADSSAILDVTSATKGVLIPRISSGQRNSILSPARGLMVYDSTINQFAYYNGNAWQLM